MEKKQISYAIDGSVEGIILEEARETRNGKLIRRRMFSSENSLFAIEEIEYDSQGRESIVSKKSPRGALVSKIIFDHHRKEKTVEEYEGSKKIQEIILNVWNDERKYYREYIYDKDDRLMAIKYCDNSDKITKLVEYEYLGDRKRKICRDGLDRVLWEEIIHYRFIDGRRIQHRIVRTDTKEDCIIEKLCYPDDDKICCKERSTNTILWEAFIDKKEYTTEKFSYNRNGDEIGREFYDKTRQLLEKYKENRKKTLQINKYDVYRGKSMDF